MKVAVLGGGLVGSPMALDLNKNKGLSVILADIDEKNLIRAKQEGIHCRILNLMEEGVIEDLVAEVDFVINALPGAIGYLSLKRLIQAGKSGVDIAFYAEDFKELHDLAVENNVSWIVDMGVAPGMSHLLSAYAASQLDQTDDIKIYVGGLPKDRDSYWQYKAPFSPSDVIEEYTRPARFIRNGKEVIMPALTEVELLDFPVVGPLEAFNSDGLRSLLSSLLVPNMIEKTLRYPGYVDKMSVLKESGLLSNEDIEINGQYVKPIDLSTALLFDQWKLEEKEIEFTIMQIRVKGRKAGRERTIIYDLYDEYCTDTHIHSMARTTGYAATVVLGLMMEGPIHRPGVHPPEALVNIKGSVEKILNGLKSKGVIYHKRII